ncbi:PHP domain-containing protein [Candidatus Pacearchaeota archaeon]|nr:PHP domain-containing protein [Candidatus Pacearchaeota archaeon]
MKFINLHVHSNFSTFDALGYPQESMEYAYENGMDAIALTDHGNMSGMTYQLFHSIKMNKEGRKIKPIFGVEAYYIDSIDEWKKEKEKSSDKKDKKEKVKGFVSEDETEREFKDSLSNRSHILLLAKNQKGLNNLFELISYSFKNGFYKKPRIDYKILKELGNNIIASSACIGGMYANVYYKFNYLGEKKFLKK